MNQDYRAAAEQFLNRLRGQGAKTTTNRLDADPGNDEARTTIINNPFYCTVIVNYNASPANQPHDPQQ